jgi:hypothetical protein
MRASEPPSTPPNHSARARLEELAEALRASGKMRPEARKALADLVAELAATIDPAAPSAHAEHVAETAASLVRALHQKRDEGVVTAARDRLDEAVERAEVRAPLAVGVARRLIETLAGLGI